MKKFLFKTGFILTCLFLLLQTAYSQAQSIVIKGAVIDSKGEPLIGVGVKVKGTSTATLTNTSGNYTITVPARESVLVFSYVSFATEERPVGTLTTINVTLKDDAVNLNDVVVVGYGEQKKKQLSTAISSLNAKQLEDRLVANPAQAMAGQVAGVNIAQASGEPGAAPVIQVRGIGSIGAGNSPLFVVDGYPLNSADNFNQINPADIESIQVLKDAAAAAIYGSRGGNGIVIVTTKRGRAGTTKFNFTNNTGFQQVTKKIDVLS
jgi:TonB-dependent SusC/RagA subfamily outer membrane receptor